MARYSLRNQHKIESYYDKKILNRILLSLKEEFNQNKEIKIEKIEGEPYEILMVNDCGHTCGRIVFYVIRKTFDVYNLAFKEFIN